MQTVQLSCIKISTISEQTKARFRTTHVIKEFHRVHPNWFPSIWYVLCKLCTYLASRLALSPNSPNRASTWASSSRCTNRRVWCIRHKLCTYLAPKLTLSPNRLKRDSIWHTSSRSFVGCVQIDFLTYGTFHADCASILHQD